jgi:hypothetical protein
MQLSQRQSLAKQRINGKILSLVMFIPGGNGNSLAIGIKKKILVKQETNGKVSLGYTI